MRFAPFAAAMMLAASLAAQPAMPRIAELNGRRALFVDGRPFLVLGLQWDCDTPFAPEISNPLYAQAARMGANTAVLPLYWREIEPEEGRYDLGGLEHRIEMARASGLRVVLVWFGAYKNGSLNYAPDYVKQDLRRFRRAHRAGGTPLRNFSCPTSSETFARDRAALEAVFRKLKEVDASRHSVILFQVENEAGLLETDRCYCPVCSREFEQGGWSAREGPRAAEAFTAYSIAKYLDGVAGAVKAIYPLPVYVNAWLGAKQDTPGRSYPSGGPVERVLDVYAATVRNIDFIAPDVYSHGLEAFRKVARAYSAHGWPLYIAEHSSGTNARAERNVFYALAEQAAIGFSPWAIDRAFPDIYGPPYVHQLDQRWSEPAYELRDSYVPIRDAMVPIAMAQRTPRLKFFVRETAEETEATMLFDELAVQAVYRTPGARGMAVRLSEAEFLVLGAGFDVQFRDRNGRGIPLARLERGRFEGGAWRQLNPVRREREDPALPFRVVEPQVIKVVLAP